MLTKKLITRLNVVMALLLVAGAGEAFAQDYYTLTYIAGDGGMLKIYDNSEYVSRYDTLVAAGSNGPIITAVPNEGYRFLQWGDDLTDNPRVEVNVQANVVVRTYFTHDGIIPPPPVVPTNVVLSYTAGNGGKLRIDSNSENVVSQYVVTVTVDSPGPAVTAVPDAGFQFVRWSDGVMKDVRVDFAVPDFSVTAIFEQEPDEDVPPRQLVYTLDIKFYKDGQNVTSVRVGEQVTMRVTPMENAEVYHYKLDEIEFSLLSNSGGSLMWTDETTPFISAKDQTGTKDYTVFFKTAGVDTIFGQGISTEGGTPLAFLGTAELEVLPDFLAVVYDAWYTSNSGTGKLDYVYVVFDKRVVLEEWFAGGSVKFDNDVTALTEEKLASVFTASGDTLKIDLSVAFSSSQSAIRTSGPIAFTLTYAPGTEWGSSAVNADDRAPPVLADAVTLKVGAVKEDGWPSPDTLVVIYSERPSDESLAINRPIKIIYAHGVQCNPDLWLNGAVVPVGGSSYYYRATYLVDGDLGIQCPFPEIGDSVIINETAGFGDQWSPPNVQDVFDNIRQPLKVVRSQIRWTAAVRNNPFRIGSSAGVVLSPGAKGAARVGVKAQIVVLDKKGALVVDTLVVSQDKIDWSWNGADKRGRYVNSGVYLFKAVCEAEIWDDADGVAGDKLSYAVTRYIGVVRGGKNLSSGNSPASKSGGGAVSFFWGGGGIKGGTLSVYDVSGNIVRKLGVSGKPADESGKRNIGEWDLTDAKGRAVADGSYVVKGMIVTDGGEKERVSAVVGVGR